MFENKFDWDKIQKEHNEGIYFCDLPKHIGISRTALEKVVNKGLLIKKKHKRIYTEKTRTILSKKRKEYLKNNKEKHTWNTSKNKSIPCEIFKNALKENNISFIEEYQPLKERFFAIDIVFPDKKLGIEINGNQHYNSDGTLKEYYQNRHNLIKNEGWQLIELHYSLVYNKSVIDKIINEIKNEYGLIKCDYSFYIKSKKEKHLSVNEYRQKRIKETNIKHANKVTLITNSGIDFNKFGWVNEVAALLNIRTQHVNKWMKRHALVFYTEKCFKKK